MNEKKGINSGSVVAGIDVGGTFTDLILIDTREGSDMGPRVCVAKTPTTVENSTAPSRARIRQTVHVAGAQFERHIDHQGLQAALLVVVDADAGLNLEPAHEHGQGLAPRFGRLEGQRAGGQGQVGYSTMSGVSQARCWPPSTAIIWPVTRDASTR